MRRQDGFWKNVLAGLLMGIGCVLPGVSGGVMAVSFGLYRPMLDAVLGIFHDTRRKLVFLAPLALGGAAGLLLGAGCADPYAPKPLRAAMGSIYHLPVWQGELEGEIPRLVQQGFTCICGHLKGGDTLPKVGERCVLVIGNEGSGVSDPVAAQCHKYRLPMYGFAESLNASVAAGILIYELAKQMHQG